MENLNQLDKHNGENVVNYVKSLRDARKWIGTATIAAMAIAVSGALYLGQYRSEGFLQFGGPIPLPLETLGKDAKKDKEGNPGIVLADYKRYAAAFSTSERFDAFVQANKLQAVDGIGGLRKAMASGDGFNKMVEPIFSFTKMDAKELMEQPKDGGNNVIGLRISYAAGNAESAQRMVGLLGRYTIDSIIYSDYSDGLRFNHIELSAKITKLDNDIIGMNERLEMYQRKGVVLKKIVNNYPEAANKSATSVISVTEDSARYLSPITHLMSGEVEALSTSETIIRLKREQAQSILLREYYDQAKSLIDTNQSGEALLRGLEAVKEGVFKTKNLNDEVVKEVYNMLTIDNQRSINLYLEKSRFIAGPTLPEKRNIRLSAVLLLSLLFGFFLSSAIVLLRKWWALNMDGARS
ncbi:lipopolysaccharide biosynthesis protein [Janthinobacterium sp. ROICE36]|uniref:lipopolysaccharide biosynthesis protein n=1 Tax=Janthinobacterium sp. ROICE36 TaxID=2048670 RepID=UPI000C7F54E9|nr:lipopolysaccharide biosynthesis protein [Janthinobacterium sp. ROICE36]PLY41801.1 lipopolysaccharide biosynthesis protein [Janthinobacterium sp. ROICE36]